MLKSGAFYKTGPLLEVLSTHCGSEPLIDTTVDERVKAVKVFFTSTLTSTSPPQVHLFRNYNLPGINHTLNQPTDNLIRGESI
jgi:hypothetical protein